MINKGLLKATKTDILSQVFKKYSLALKSANQISFKSATAMDWGILALDIGVDIYTDLVLESTYFDEQYEENVVLQKMGSKDTVKQVIKWWINIAYADIKWGIAYTSGHPIVGAREAVAGNASVLFDILKEDTELANDLFNTKIDLEYKKLLSEIWDLEFRYARDVSPKLTPPSRKKSCLGKLLKG